MAWSSTAKKADPRFAVQNKSAYYPAVTALHIPATLERMEVIESRSGRGGVCGQALTVDPAAEWRPGGASPGVRKLLHRPGSTHGLMLIKPACGVGGENSADFIAHPAEDGELLSLGALGVGGVVEREVVAVHLAGE